MTQVWDAIVVGSGMGGATVGYKLAEAGLKVLFVEKGERLMNPADGARGVFPETHVKTTDLCAEELKKHGRWSSPMNFVFGNKRSSSIPFIGEGTGGSSLLYGMAFERFQQSDFTPRDFHSKHPDLSRSCLPQQWPISFEEMTEFYELAEVLYQTKKEAHSTTPLSAASQEFFDFFRQSNLDPYLLPKSRELREDCQECQGMLCPWDCKNDAAKICLRPSLERGAQILTSCEAVRLKHDDHRVEAVICNYRGQPIELRGRLILLACGALKTPELLLRSQSPQHPHGLGNSSGMVGKNLMRHFFDLYIVFPKYTNAKGMRKEIGFNNWYVDKEEKLGTVQAFGKMPPAEAILMEMEMKIKSLLGSVGVFVFIPFKPVIRMILNIISTKGFVFVSLIEDLPFPENQVSLGPTCPEITLNISEGEKARIELMRRKMKHLFKSYFCLRIKSAEDVTRLAHACGTCRMGNDSKTSVVDANNKVHGIENLYVADASFFPSSGGINPGLTVVANALRVAKHLTRD